MVAMWSFGKYEGKKVLAMNECYRHCITVEVPEVPSPPSAMGIKGLQIIS